MKRRVRFPNPCFCQICGGPVRRDFAFDVGPSQWVHPSCFAYTHSASGTNGEVPDRPLEKGQRLQHTCGNAMCCNPAHLEIAS
jgi:hypothetical protein